MKQMSLLGRLLVFIFFFSLVSGLVFRVQIADAVGNKVFGDTAEYLQDQDTISIRKVWFAKESEVTQKIVVSNPALIRQSNGQADIALSLSAVMPTGEYPIVRVNLLDPHDVILRSHDFRPDAYAHDQILARNEVIRLTVPLLGDERRFTAEIVSR